MTTMTAQLEHPDHGLAAQVLDADEWRARRDAHRRAVEELIGPYLDARRRGGCLDRVEREGLGELAPVVGGEPQPGLPVGGRFDGYDDHAARGSGIGGHRDDSPTPGQRAGGVPAPC